MRILVIKGGSAYGDILFATPVLRELRRQYPEAEIEVIGKLNAYEILAENPHMDRFIAGRYMRRKQFAKSNSYDRVIDITGIEVRDPYAATTEVYLLNCRKAGIETTDLDPEFHLSQAEIDAAKVYLREAGISDSPFVFIQHRTGHPLKRYPFRQLLDVVDHLASRGYRIVLSETEEENKELVSRLPLHLLSNDKGGMLPFRIVCAILSCAAAHVGIDSVFAHIAGALSIPSVVLFGPYSGSLLASRYRHTQVIQMDLVCSPCNCYGPICAHSGNTSPRCMSEIQPDGIIDAFDSVTHGSKKDSCTTENCVDIEIPQPHQCPLCGRRHSRFAGQRADSMFYFGCKHCGSIYLMSQCKEAKRIFGKGILTSDISKMSPEDTFKEFLMEILQRIGVSALPSTAAVEPTADGEEPDLLLYAQETDGDKKISRRRSEQTGNAPAYDMIFVRNILAFEKIPALFDMIRKHLASDGLLIIAYYKVIPKQYSPTMKIVRGSNVDGISSLKGLTNICRRHRFSLMNVVESKTSSFLLSIWKSDA